MKAKWWMDLKPGDKVYVRMEREKDCGAAEVYSVGRKYILVSLRGRSIHVLKSDGCTEDYPKFPVYVSEEDFRDQMRLQKAFRDAVSLYTNLTRDRNFRATASHVERMQQLYLEIVRGEG